MESKLEQFVAVTGAPHDVARGLLEACGWNLELAINMQIESGSAGGMYHPPVHSIGASGNSLPTPRNSKQSESEDDGLLSPTSYELLHGVRAPIPQTEGVLIEEDTPPRRIVRSRRLPQTVFDPFQDYSNTSGKFAGPGDPSKKRNLAELFKPPHDLMFLGTFHEAKLAGQHHKKWLLINIQDSKEFSSQVLNRDVWSNHNVKEIVKQHFIFWQIHRITDDGTRFRQLYHVDSFPYIAVIDPRTGENMSHWGTLSPAVFMEVIQEFLVDNVYDPTETSGSINIDGVVDRSEESQLEAAIKASLQDQKKTTSSKKSSSKCQLVFSDDSDVDCVSLISSGDDAPSDMEQGYSQDEVEFIGNSVGGGISTSTRLLNPGAQMTDRMHESGVSYNSTDRSQNSYRTSNNFHSPEKSASRKTKQNRKRYSLRDDELCDELPRKMMRTEISNSLQGDGSSKEAYPGSLYNSGNLIGEEALRIQQYSSSTRTNHKGGGFVREEISFILFRLPDGSRMQKPFVSAHPIQELFDFLNSKGFPESEHEVVSQFPRRNLTDIDHNTTFKDLGLYPRETVFVHTVE